MPALESSIWNRWGLIVDVHGCLDARARPRRRAGPFVEQQQLLWGRLAHQNSCHCQKELTIFLVQAPARQGKQAFDMS